MYSMLSPTFAYVRHQVKLYYTQTPCLKVQRWGYCKSVPLKQTGLPQGVQTTAQLCHFQAELWRHVAQITIADIQS